MLTNDARFLDARVPVPLLATIPLGDLLPVEAYAAIRTTSSFLLSVWGQVLHCNTGLRLS